VLLTIPETDYLKGLIVRVRKRAKGVGREATVPAAAEGE
jgi:hypothetical protein